MIIKPVTNEAYKLLHTGALAIAQVESNGICIDTRYLVDITEKIQKRVQQLDKDIREDKVFICWRKRFGTQTNLGSRVQLGKILFEDMKVKSFERTTTGRYITDEEALKRIDLPFVQKYLQIEKLKKAKNTYLTGILRETTPEGFIHPFFNLHIARTFRSSSNHPNFQNIPVRDPLIKKLIRRTFIPRSHNRQLVELDYSGVEVHGSAWYHKDPVMLKYIADPKKDMHRDMAQQCYMLSKNQVTSEIRYCGKSNFVFPQFYGDWYISCARYLWEAIDKTPLKTTDGVPLKEWLRTKGIKKLGLCDPKSTPRPGTFEKHIKDVEDDFWYNRFKVYGKWRETWWRAYQKKGSLAMLSGFKVQGYLKRKEVISYPIQGTAFHCLLWSLIRINHLLNKYKMKSCIVGQIHDSIVGDVLVEELKDYLEIAQKVMTRDIRKHWPWIITELKVDAEAAPPGKSWYEKEEIKI